MTPPIIAGLDTEYGLWIEARGAHEQVDDAADFVRAYPGKGFAGWDYRFESPRNDLRGFRLERLATDPVDAEFDRGRQHAPDKDIRSDRVTLNGGRLYNDHGHPEYATPECLSLDGVAAADQFGDQVMRDAARAYTQSHGRSVRVYKNNTDFHGASYGAHESYLAPRDLGYEKLFPAIMPMLVARLPLVGAGKVGSETGNAVSYQISQRADFFVEAANAETLYRRPIFNTRDEPHGEAADFIRLHVISGDANMIAASTRRRVGLVRLALQLAAIGEAPDWPIQDPVVSAKAISRDESYKFEIGLGGSRWTTAGEVLESYFAAAEARLDLAAEDCGLIAECRQLLADLHQDFDAFAYRVDWAAKRRMLEQFMAEEGMEWNDPSLRSFDLEYHNIDPAEGLHAALMEMGQVAPNPPPITEPERSRAWLRAAAIRNFPQDILQVGWRRIAVSAGGKTVDLDLAPGLVLPETLEAPRSAEDLVQLLAAMQ